VPVNFFTGETRFTPAGAAALAELAEAIKEQEVHEFKLVGHADPRGNAQFNLDLSKRRAQAVRDELVNRGIQARITIEGKGDTEPFDVSVLGRPVSQDEAWQLDRRVEWITAGGAK
jgi:outer membrane protein OmpA-like peptidoglycan-associated protein